MAEITKLMYYANGRNKLSNDSDKFIFKNSQLGFEGASDDSYETFLSVEDPTSSDKTITLPNSTGTTVLRSSSTSLTAGQFLIASSDTNIIESSSLLTVNTSSNFVGINQSSPEVTLHITGEADDKAQIRLEQHNDGNDAPDIRTKKSRGTNTSPTNNLAGDYLFRFNVESRESGSYQLKGGFQFDTSSTDVSKCKMQIKTHNGTSNATRLGVDKDGKFYINNGDNTITFPNSRGSANQVLQTNGSGVLSFATVSGSGIASVSADTDPSLGGDLEVGANKIHSSSGNVKIEAGTGGGYIDITTAASSNGNIYLRPQSGGGSGDGNVGIGNGFTPGSSKPTFTLQVKDDNNTGFVSKIENTTTGTSTSCIQLSLNPSTTNVDTTNKFLSFTKGTSEKGYLAGDGSGGLQLTSGNNLDIKSSANINIKSSSATIAEFDTTTSKFLFGAPAVTEGNGQEHLKVKEEAFSTSSGDPGLVVVHNTHNNHSTRILTLKGGNQSSSTPSANTRYVDIFSGNNTVVGALIGDGSGGVQLTNSFTGSHPTIISSSEVISLGFIVESTGVIWANNQESISTAIPKVALTNTNNSKKVFGVISSTSSDYEGYVAAWGVGESESQITVNSIGEGKVWVTNINGNIENGDYITTSEISGHGRLQDDDLLHNYTVAKCTETVDWSTVTDTITHNGVDYKKYLIACTYHCG